MTIANDNERHQNEKFSAANHQTPVSIAAAIKAKPITALPA
ncbi:hypothetical protein [Synechococcus sp. UW179A]|nr:hypothetical protein [Synechococcus sp. UW179A]